eukprot:gene4850-9668_t
MFALLIHFPLCFGFLKSLFSKDKASEGQTISIELHLKGANPQSYDKMSAETFICDSGSVHLNRSQINDNFCDCQDGTDESGTSACISGHFHCINRGYKIVKIPSSRVDDGLCDCCDGSDEGYLTKCPNTCESVASSEKAQIQKLQQSYATGSKIRLEYIEQIKDELHKKSSNIDALKHAAEQANNEVEKLRDFKRKEEEIEEKTEIHQKVEIINKITNRLGNQILNIELLSPLLSSLFDLIKYSEDDVKSSLLDLNAELLRNFLLHVVQQRQATNELQLLWGYYLISGSLAGARDFAHDLIHPPAPEPIITADGESIPAPPNDDPVNTCPALFAGSESVCSIGLDIGELLSQADVDYKRPETETARAAFEAAEKVHRDARSMLQEAQDAARDLEKHANRLEYLALGGKCFKAVDGKFTYELCVMASISQTAEGEDTVQLGKFEEFEDNEDGTLTMHFRDGQYCHAFGPRSADVIVSCGPENVLRDASEPSTCFYAFKLETPAACTPNFAEMNGIF